VIGYASRTGTKRNLDALRSAGWRLLVSASGVHRTEGFAYAIDNGAWSAFSQGKPWDEAAFVALLDKHGALADWVVSPDIVQGGRASLDVSLAWLPRLLDLCPRVLLAVQDGHEPSDVEHLLGDRVGIFVGGSTSWKESSTLSTWGPLARARGCWLHVGRVNTARRISICSSAGASSFDGTSVTQFSVNIRHLDAARRLGQLGLENPGPCWAEPPQRNQKLARPSTAEGEQTSLDLEPGHED
jgi:hypothetical protein